MSGKNGHQSDGSPEYDRNDTPGWGKKGGIGVYGILSDFIREALGEVSVIIGAIRRKFRRRIIENLREKRTRILKEAEDGIIEYLLRQIKIDISNVGELSRERLKAIAYFLRPWEKIKANYKNGDIVGYSIIEDFSEYGLTPIKLRKIREQHEARMKKLGCLTVDEYMHIWKCFIKDGCSEDKKFFGNKEPVNFLKDLSEGVKVEKTKMYGIDGFLVEIPLPDGCNIEYFKSENSVTLEEFEKNSAFSENSFSVEEIGKLIKDVYGYLKRRGIDITPKSYDEKTSERRDMNFAKDLRSREKPWCAGPEGTGRVKYLTKLYEHYYTKDREEDGIPNSRVILFSYDQRLHFISRLLEPKDKCWLLLKPEKR